jgi:phosphoenolpyruvate synthase/pyruvate phosphate dikinase
MKLKFGTKAQTLSALKGNINSAQVLDMYVINLFEWKNNKSKILDLIKKRFGKLELIVRSSSIQEDNYKNSNAGHFVSVTNVQNHEIEQAITKVFGSYNSEDPNQEVLIQPMLKDVTCSGVAFSHDQSNASPYRIINWSQGEDTSAITAGRFGNTWTQAAKSSTLMPEFISRVVNLIDELLEKFDEAAIDIEFAFTFAPEQEVLWLLQVRPLNLERDMESIQNQQNRLSQIANRLKELMKPHPDVLGESALYGVMPDWNPAEIIGLKPKPLALSLYRELITDSIWAYQRHNYGYRNLRSFPLLVNFFGAPYIDVRVSFNSFIPSNLDEIVAGKLVNYYINSLVSNPQWHDKVEFEIVFSCFTFDLPQRIKVLKKHGFVNNEIDAILSSLRILTNNIVDPKNGHWIKDSERIQDLKARREKILDSDLSSIDKVYWLVEDVKRYGTLPFAGLARVGFIAVQILRSMVSVGVFTKQELDLFLSTINTVAKQMKKDKITLDQRSFLTRYGHLRPGTYDISAPTYSENPNLYFNWNNKESTWTDPQNEISLSNRQKEEITKILRINSLSIEPDELLIFLKSAIELRELSKFEFTKNVSNILSLVKEFGTNFNIESDDLAYANYNCFKELYIGIRDPEHTLLQSIQEGKNTYAQVERLNLPPLIANPDDIWGFKSPDVSPNYITNKKAIGDVISELTNNSLEGTIVCIPSADPGFDWIFNYSIAGLITAWGGSNSHMAIRAGELGIPAVIGAGDTFFNLWSKSKRLSINCAEKRVNVIS